MTPQEIHEIEKEALKIFNKEYNGINLFPLNNSLEIFITEPLYKIAKNKLYPGVKEKNLKRENKQHIQNWMKHKLYNCIRSYYQFDIYEYSEDPVFLIPPPSEAMDEEHEPIVSNVLPNICKLCQTGFLEKRIEGLVCQHCGQVDETIFEGGRDFKGHQVGGSLGRWSTAGDKIRKQLFEFYELNQNKISLEQINFIKNLPKNTPKNVIILNLLQILKKNNVNINSELKQNIIGHFEIKNIKQKETILNFN